jgi:hypothetical protein
MSERRSVDRDRYWEEREPGRAPGQPGEQRAVLARITQLIWFFAGVLEALLGIRFLLKLLAANPDAGFATFVYGITDVFLAPFAGLTATPSASGAVLEISTLVAMLVYGLVAWGIVRLVWILFDRWGGA